MYILIHIYQLYSTIVTHSKIQNFNQINNNNSEIINDISLFYQEILLGRKVNISLCIYLTDFILMINQYIHT